jgi:hypothetical protein
MALKRLHGVFPGERSPTMRTPEFEKICHAVGSGQEMWVKHIVTHQVGKVLTCGEEEFEVDVNGVHKTWSKANCVETIH